MGDAFSDIVKDEERGKLFYEYVEAIVSYLENPCGESLSRVVEKAERTDSIRGGYWGNSTKLLHGLEECLDRLAAGDEREWGKLLSSLDYHRPVYARLKSHSPFADKLLVVADYGMGFLRIHGELEPFINNLLNHVKGWQIYDCDKFLISMDQPNIEATWLDCGYVQPKQEGPRSVRKP